MNLSCSPSVSASQDDTAVELQHAESSELVQRGMALNGEGQLAEALECFDEAIHRRLRLPLEDNPWHRWGLTAGLMNRAEVLVKQGRGDEALAAWTEALRHLEMLPLEIEPAFRWRLGLARMNRGLTLQSMGRLTEALVCLDTAVSTLRHEALNTPRDFGTLGCAFLNRSRLLLQMNRPAESMAGAEESLALLEPLEDADPAAAVQGLHARHAWCQSLARLLEEGLVEIEQADAWIHAATDHVERALELMSAWPAQRTWFGDLPVQFFHFGCRIYLAYQPHFLGEFMLDVLRPEAFLPVDAALDEKAEEVLQNAARVIRERGLTDLGLNRLDDLLAMLERLESAARTLRRWRQERWPELASTPAGISCS